MKNATRHFVESAVVVACIIAVAGCAKQTTHLTAVSTTAPAGKAVNEVKKVEFGPVYFERDKTVLTPDALSLLYRVGSFLTNNPQFSLVIESHADERNDPFYDNYLSEERAKSVYNWLVLYGFYNIAQNRVTVHTDGNNGLAQKNCGDDDALS